MSLTLCDAPQTQPCWTLLERSAPQVYPVESNSLSEQAAIWASCYSMTPKLPLPEHCHSTGAQRSSSLALRDAPQTKCSVFSYVFLLNLPSVFLLIGRLLLTFPNLFNTLPTAETVSSAIGVTILHPVTCSAHSMPQVPLKWNAPEVKRLSNCDMCETHLLMSTS